MKCVYHNDRDAEFICSSCGQPICRECATSVSGKNVCRTCAYKSTQYNTQQYNIQPYKGRDEVNGFLFLIFAAVPGLRHMYLGLMKRGLEFLIAFFGIISFSFLLRNAGDILIPLMFIIWFYSAFDSYRCRKLISKGEKAEDNSIFEDYGIDQIKGFFLRRKKFTGIAIMFIGMYMLLSQLRWFIGRYNFSDRIERLVFDTIDFGFDAIIPLLLIAGGIYIMSSAKRRVSAKDIQDNIHETAYNSEE